MTDTLDATWFADTFEAVKNWGRWGPEDERGTLNLLTPDRVAAAAGLVASGRQVSCALDLATEPRPDNMHPVQHHMLQAGDDPDLAMLPGFQQSTDFVGLACHGSTVSHLDALCHIFVDGLMYNGFPAGEVRSTGARRNTVMSVSGGLVGRGVLLDIPRILGQPWLDADHRIVPEELEAAEAAAGLTVGPGDILLVSTGRLPRQEAAGAAAFVGGMAGLHPTCIRWLHERDVAVLGSDGISDSLGAPMVERWPLPIHQCVIAAMGVHLLDNLDLVGVGQACADIGRWEFLFSAAPLRIRGGTGCAVNPVAVF